ncbi:hypothetical protein [Elizabethkingia miricola]|uniref:hypothetical protein n=1 Tax=Elizabethkingia miricola TaxID=172045 RepID=UPI00099B0029|nr:hypothetical protein [Elizabethkingia miricola]OPC37697.1 hypothetical protein BAX99_16570 [Elizabethkingia miricola]
MKTFLLLSVLASTFAFGQSKELSEKQAYQMFMKSNVSKALKLKKEDLKKMYNIGLNKESVMLNTVSKQELNYIKNYYCCAKLDDKELIIVESKEQVREKMKNFPL